MNFLEKNLEDILFETPNHYLHNRGLFINGIKRRQVKIGNYGISDLITIGRTLGFLNVTVYELKKDFVNVNTFLQGVRYIKGIKSYFDKRGIVANFNLVLIGSSVDLNSDFVYTVDVLSSQEFNYKVYEYKYQFDGIRFNRICNYSLINEGF
jgi:hypothetical protein